MKKLLSLILSLSCFGISYSQSPVEIHVDGTGPDVAGTIINITIDGNDTYPYEPHLIVTNTSGTDHQWRIRRIRTDVPASWADQICWPPYCYTPTVDNYITPNTGGNPAPIIMANSDTTSGGLLAEIKPRITPDMAYNGNALFMYYITDVPGNYIDSVGVQFFFYVGNEELEPNLSMTVSPNPASESVTINTNATNNADVEIVDLLGSKVFKGSTINGELNFDVSTLNNGVYFALIKEEGLKPVTKKFIVRH